MRPECKRYDAITSTGSKNNRAALKGGPALSYFPTNSYKYKADPIILSARLPRFKEYRFTERLYRVDAMCGRLRHLYDVYYALFLPYGHDMRAVAELLKLAHLSCGYLDPLGKLIRGLFKLFYNRLRHAHARDVGV